MAFERWFTVLAARLRALFAGSSLDRDLDDELRYHLDRLVETNVANGLSPDAARRAAHLAMGGIERRKEECRDARGTRLVADLLQDIRYATRTLRQAPAFTLIAVSSLGLGIAATIAVFTAVDALMWRRLPVENPSRLVTLEGNRRLPSFEVVGVVSDAAHGTRARQRGALYYPAGQNTRRLRWMCLVIRTAGDPLALSADVRRELHAVDPRLPIVKINSLEDQLNDALALDRLVMDLSVGFALLALVLAAAGVYGTLSYAVTRRTREIGVRVALGATGRGVIAMVIKRISCWSPEESRSACP